MPFPPNPRRSYVGVTVTLTSANTPYSLYALLNAVTGAQTPASDCPASCRELNIQSQSPAVTGGNAGNTDVVLIGDSFISLTNYAYVLAVGASRTYRSSSTSSVQVGSIYVESPTAGQKLNIELEMA
jgi:hypothetical protein